MRKTNPQCILIAIRDFHPGFRMANLFDMRFIINTGKGGVGKTTQSVAMAQAFARRGKRAFIMQMNVPDKIGPLFGKTPITGEVPIEVAQNIWVVNPTPQEAMREYAMMILRFKAVYRTVFENRIVRRFLRMMPGLPELVMLGKAYFHESETHKNGTHVWDVVIIDAPATGHGLFLLQIPSVIDDALGDGLMAQEAKRMLALLKDRRKSMLNIVMLAEEMPVNESVELKARVDNEIGMQVGYALANNVFPHVFTGPEARQLEALRDAAPQDPKGVRSILDAGLFRYERTKLQDHYLKRAARELKLPVIEVPFIFEAELKPEHVRQLSDAMVRAVERAEASA